MAYQEKQFSFPGGLPGLSERQLTEHLKLYTGYVRQVNAGLGLFPFEWNGMRLHELYFEQLSAQPTPASGLLPSTLADEIRKAGLTRGSGWVLVTHDRMAEKFFVTWVADHELGHLGGLPILLALDVWEHAYLLDYLPSGRKDYIEAFFKNLDWAVIEKRLHA